MTDAQTKATLDSIGAGKAPHYAFVFDDSARSNAVIALAKTNPDLRARIEAPAFRLWEMGKSHFQFLVLWGTWGYSGGLTIPTADMGNLLEQALPAVVKRTLEKGGLCAWAVATDSQHEAAIQARLAQLQPTQGRTQ